MDEIQVLLVDDHVELRAALRRLIDSQPDLRLVAEANACARSRGQSLTHRSEQVALPG